METRTTCPLGSECEDIKDGVKYMCAWYTKIRGADPQTGEEIDEFRCAMQWMPLLQIEHSKHERQTGAAVESMRNGIVQGLALSSQSRQGITHVQDVEE